MVLSSICAFLVLFFVIFITLLKLDTSMSYWQGGEGVCLGESMEQ